MSKNRVSRATAARLLLADFDPQIQHIYAQPFRLVARVGGQVRNGVMTLHVIHGQAPVGSATATLLAGRGERASSRWWLGWHRSDHCVPAGIADCVYGCAPRWLRPIDRYSTGSTNRFSRVEVASPPRITIAIGYSISWPGRLP